MKSRANPLLGNPLLGKVEQNSEQNSEQKLSKILCKKSLQTSVRFLLHFFKKWIFSKSGLYGSRYNPLQLRRFIEFI